MNAFYGTPFAPGYYPSGIPFYPEYAGFYPGPVDIVGQGALRPGPMTAPGGAEAPPAPSVLDKTRNFLSSSNTTTGIKNGYLVAGALAIGLAWYGHSKHWFGKPVRR